MARNKIGGRIFSGSCVGNSFGSGFFGSKYFSNSYKSAIAIIPPVRKICIKCRKQEQIINKLCKECISVVGDE